MRTHEKGHCNLPPLPESCNCQAGELRAGVSQEAPVRLPGPRLVYDLRRSGRNSALFYRDLSLFTGKVLAQIELQASLTLRRYQRYVTMDLREPPRSQGEYAVELLTLGMAIRLYSGSAAATPSWVVDLGRELFWMRRRSRQIKPVIDFLRAGLFQMFMRRDKGSNGSAKDRSAPDERGAAMGALPRLIEWLHATGEFEQESLRLDDWHSYLRALDPSEAEYTVDLSLRLFDWFAEAAGAALGPYTSGVPEFLAGTYAQRFWREDLIFCARQPVEYHLAMVASELMNAAMREEFVAKPRKILLVPTCMRGERADECRAQVDGVDVTCTGCDPECPVNRITRQMREVDVETFLVPHAAGFSRILERWERDPETGVAAVACLPNILAGGYEMRAREIASQCVPLDYPGCRKHWTDDGISTGVNEERLVELVTEEP